MKYVRCCVCVCILDASLCYFVVPSACRVLLGPLVLFAASLAAKFWSTTGSEAVLHLNVVVCRRGGCTLSSRLPVALCSCCLKKRGINQDLLCSAREMGCFGYCTLQIRERAVD